jgi:fucose 4-O-acetylase-like acetyltransferase
MRAIAFPPISVTSAAAATGDRLDWLDRARGIGIVLVVMGHAFVGLIAAKSATREMELLSDFIYSFHMPLFFMLSGMASAGLMRQPLTVFSQRVALRTLYPYVLWSILFLCVHSLGAGMTNTQSGFDQVLRLYMDPVAVYWFLLAMLLCQVLGRVLIATPDLVVVPLALLMIIVGLGVGHERYIVGKLSGYQFIHMVGFYLLAQRVGLQTFDRLTDPTRVDLRTLVILAFGLTAITLIACFNGPVFSTFWTLPAAFGASFLVMVLGRRLGDGFLGRLMKVFGVSAMAIFVVHVMITGSTRIAMDRLLQFDQPWAVAAIATVLGLWAPTIADLIAKRFGFAGVLGWR